MTLTPFSPTLKFLSTLWLIMASHLAWSQVIVRTYNDQNLNAVFDDSEELVTGLQVLGFDDSGIELPFLDDGAGTFFLPAEVITSRIRVEVRGYNRTIKQGKNRPTSVFMASNGDQVDVPVLVGTHLMDAETAQILIPCYEKGASKLHKESPAFVRFPFLAEGVAAQFGGEGPDPVEDASISEIGSTWGVAFQGSHNRAFASTILKRHVGLGPQGLDAVYWLDYSEMKDNPTVNYFKLQGIVPSVGPAIDMGHVIREIVDVEINDTMPYALSTVEDRIRRASYDVDAFDKVGKTSFGDIELGEDGRTLWMVNLHQRSIMTLDIGQKEFAVTGENLTNHLIEELPGIPNLNFRFRHCINIGGNSNVDGAESFTDPNKVAWDKNRYSQGGDAGYSAFTITNTLNSSEKTSAEELYQTYRKGTFNYEVPVPVDENYEIILHFAEPNNVGIGNRVFDIHNGDDLLIENFDIVAASGGARKAYVLKLNATSKDKKLNLRFTPKKGEAILSGLEVIGTSISQSGILRPWGLTFRDGRGYIGIVSDASMSMSRDHLFAYVLSFDPENIAAGFKEEVSFPLGYPRERASNADQKKPQPLRSSSWQPWVDTWEETQIPTKGEPLNIRNALLCSYAQPMVSEINFTGDGSIVIGLMDRWAHQVGHNNYNTILGDRTLIIGYACGDILKAFSDGNGSFNLEQTNSDDGLYYRKDDGPSYAGEFFYEDYYATDLAHHGELITGGMVLFPGRDEVVATVHNPRETRVPYFEFRGLFTQGLHFYDANTGKKTRDYLFVDQYILGKANGLGDIEFAALPPPPAVGNYVWCDANANGVQDPSEYGIDGIRVRLLDSENALAQVALQVTSGGGEYYFDNLLPNHCYELRIDLADLEALGYVGGTSPLQVGDSISDSNADDQTVPGFAIARFCTGNEGINRDDIDFGFLGPEALDGFKIECEDPNIMTMNPPCADFDLAEVAACATNVTNTTVRLYPSFNEADSMLNEITADIRVCGADSIVYARVMINDDPFCYAISQIQLHVRTDGGMDVDFLTEICPGATFDILQFLQDKGFRGDATTEIFTDENKSIPFVGDLTAVDPGGVFPYILYYDDTLADGGCGTCGLVELVALPGAMISAGTPDTLCGLECLDLTTLGAVFDPNGSGATEALWTTDGYGTFLDDNTFAGARFYCPDSLDLVAGVITLTLTVTDDVCNPMGVSSSVLIYLRSDAPQILPLPGPDTIDCYHPFAIDPTFQNDTFPGCRLLVECEDTLIGTVVDYEVLLGDCENIIKQVKRTLRFTYNKEEYFCMDTIAIRALPDTIVCPPEKDSVYCHDDYLKDENGHPSPYVTGFPMADTIPLWPQLPAVCDILIHYKDWKFDGECPITIRRDWYIKNGCTGSFDTCVQWIMIFDTLGPTIVKDTTKGRYDAMGNLLVPADVHDCEGYTYLPPIMAIDTCTDVKIVKAIIPNVATVAYEYNPASGYWESHKQIKIPRTETPLPIYFEAYDNCHNVTRDTCYVMVKDFLKPVAICDKGLNVTLEDTIVWVSAESMNEGSSDNCGVSMVLARRSDWATACGMNLCDDLDLLCVGAHHDSIWCPTLEKDKNINPIEAHYAKTLEWLCSDGQDCSSLILAGWTYDLIKYATLQCKGYGQISTAAFNKLLEDTACHVEITGSGDYDYYGNLASALSHLYCYKLDSTPDLDFVAHDTKAIASMLSLRDQASQIGGGWSKEVPFCCEDACQNVMVELLVMDYWCNWSKCWTMVSVEDKNPPKITHELPDITLTCSGYNALYAEAVESALQGDFEALQAKLGFFDKDRETAYGSTPESFILYDLECDSNLVIKDSLVYDPHFGYVWKSFEYHEFRYDTIQKIRRNGQVLDNCGLQCIELMPWVNIDACGNGYIKRTFKFIGECFSDVNGHHGDTLTRSQMIYIYPDCPISRSMFHLPKDTILQACNIEYATNGSGQVGGDASPEYTGRGQLLFDYEICRQIGIGYYDKVFKILGGDQGCYKILRTWCFANWCAMGDTPQEKEWWFNPKYQGRYFSYVQKIIVQDTMPPACTILDLPAVVEASGCEYAINATIVVEDACEEVQYAWKIQDTKTNSVVATGNSHLDLSQTDQFSVETPELPSGTYVLKVLLTDHCQNEGICEQKFEIVAGKKPAPICLSSVTVELNPWDTNGDGIIDTAIASIQAKDLDVSSAAACGSNDADLIFLIDNGNGAASLPEDDATSLEFGCDDVGQNAIRLYVLDLNGAWDFCSVIVQVQNNMGGCPDVQATNDSRSQIIADHLETPVRESIVPLSEQDISYKVSVENQAINAVFQNTDRAELMQNYPNPFREATHIPFYLPAQQTYTLSIFAISGQLMYEVEGIGSKGVNILSFERGILGYESGGVFYYQLKTELFVASKKMLLMN